MAMANEQQISCITRQQPGLPALCREANAHRAALRVLARAETADNARLHGRMISVQHHLFALASCLSRCSLCHPASCPGSAR